MQKPIPDTRTLAIDVLHHALTKKMAPEFISLSLFGAADIAENDARFVRAQVLTALRHLGQLDTMLARYIDKPLPPAKAWVQCALRIGLAQVKFDTVPAHAGVHATVEAVKHSKFKALSGMVNAVLKKAVADSNAADASTNIPDWLATQWQRHYGEAVTARMAEVAAVQPAYDVQVTDDIAGVERLNAHSVRVHSFDALMHLLKTHPQAFVQDIAASYPVLMLGDIRGKQIVEIGAAPGGKTMQMLQAGANVIALDRSATRMQRLNENLEARGLKAQCIVTDALAYTPASAPDIVVLDAPCSATGTWRKHPEVLHLVEEKTIVELAEIQARLMAHAWRWLPPGGQLLYIVCSLQEEEGEGQLSRFMATHGDAKLVTVENAEIYPQALRADGTLRTHLAMMEDKGGMDGFFAALLQKA